MAMPLNLMMEQQEKIEGLEENVLILPISHQKSMDQKIWPRNVGAFERSFSKDQEKQRENSEFQLQSMN